MAEIHQFPERSVREWEGIARALGETLAELGHSSEAIQAVQEKLRPAVIDAFRVGSFPISCSSAEEAVRAIEVAMKDVVNHFLLALAVLAIENHELKQQIGE